MKFKAIVTVALIAAGLTMTTALSADAQGMHKKMNRHHRHMQSRMHQRNDAMRYGNRIDGRMKDHNFRSDRMDRNRMNQADHRMQAQGHFKGRRNGSMNDMRNGRMQDHGGFDRRKDGRPSDRTRNNGSSNDRRNDQR